MYEYEKASEKKIAIFQNNPKDSMLDNHSLKKEYEGYRSIDITADYRTLYKEKQEDDEKITYFVTFGTHKELYGN